MVRKEEVVETPLPAALVPLWLFWGCRPLSWPGGSSKNPRLWASFCCSSPHGLEPPATRFLPSTEAALCVRSDARPPVCAINLLPPSHCAKLWDHLGPPIPANTLYLKHPFLWAPRHSPTFLLKSPVMLPGRVNFIRTALPHTQRLHWQVRILKSVQDFQDPSSRAKWTGKGWCILRVCHCWGLSLAEHWLWKPANLNLSLACCGFLGNWLKLSELQFVGDTSVSSGEMPIWQGAGSLWYFSSDF